MERCESYSAQGDHLGAGLTAAMYRAKATAETENIVYGLSGWDVRVEDMEQIYMDWRSWQQAGKNMNSIHTLVCGSDNDERDNI